ncbi:S-layer homology domain-containing protein [Paenibacillus sp. DMB20]|uniref:S-layer homology domain-containing protein n=1 Tax=Paenibacillus sp. DMB20 TaxID=1642570 RepID=UPI000627DCC9|nr:S-layer homology domain-containing protein [Paenibacillus sp. DMB20]KKO53341.1 S-layer protein [Paenibacillus sp. DMB20]
MKKTMKIVTTLLISSSLLGAGAASAFAFTDIEDSGQLAIVKALQSKGIIQGITADKFAPKKTITAAQAIQMVIKATGLEAYPNYSGKSFSSVPDRAWYADAVKIAAMHGLPVSNETKWNEPVTREDFANLLYSAISETGNYPVVLMHINVADEDQMKKESIGAVQFLLLTDITDLDKDGKFHPKENLTRIEAAKMTHAAMKFIAEHKHNTPGQDDTAEEGISTKVVKVTDEVNKVVITKDGLPNPGYSIAVDSIDFVTDSEAVVYYKVIGPDPGKMYPQVISKSSVDVFVPSKFTVKVRAAK